MRLADFIEQQMPAILQAWDSFAATLTPAARGMDAAGLRDHAEQMLRPIALDLRTAQSSDELSVAGSAEGSWDASRIKQALGNLIANAANYGAPRGKISVDLRADEAQVHLPVKNEGGTLPSETLSSLFEPLRRMPNCANDDRAHLGLGLFIVREVAHAHGGTVTVESTDGVTEFSLHLPKA